MENDLETELSKRQGHVARISQECVLLLSLFEIDEAIFEGNYHMRCLPIPSSSASPSASSRNTTIDDLGTWF